MSENSTVPANESFESAVKKLEAIIHSLEDKNLCLDDALKHFEEGIRLMRICENHLSSAEGKIRQLLHGEDGALVEKVLGSSIEFLRNGTDYESDS
jgi:exodeoxyribonuclease VII small subunit